MAPQLTAGPGGVILSWLEVDSSTAVNSTADNSTAGDAEGEVHTLRFARFQGDHSQEGGSQESRGAWSSPGHIVTGGDFFANWADVPAVFALTAEDWVAHWLQRNGESTYAYGVRLRTTADAGSSWQDRGWLHDDTSPTEHGFVSWAAAEGSASGAGAQAFWLDGRAMVGHEGHGGGNMAVRTAQVTLGAKDAVRDAEDAQVAISPSQTLDERTCECCQTDVARTSDGYVVVYRDRSEAEIRDIVAVRSTGDGWQEPRVIAEDGWWIPACPVNGPAVDAREQRVVVAWFSAADQEPRVRLAFSHDGGASFETPLEVAPTVAGQKPTGRVDVAMTADGGAVVTWLTESDGSTQPARSGVALTSFSADGRRGETILLGETTMSRASGVPRLQLVDSESSPEALVVWREVSTTAHLRAVTVPVRF